jgi:hypothetical protein
MFWIGSFSSRLVSVSIESHVVVALEEGKRECWTTSAMGEWVSRRRSRLSHQDIACVRRNIGIMGVWMLHRHGL